MFHDKYLYTSANIYYMPQLTDEPSSNFIVLGVTEADVKEYSLEWARKKREDLFSSCECVHWIQGTPYFVAKCTSLPQGFELIKGFTYNLDISLVYYGDALEESPYGIIKWGPYEKKILEVGVLYEDLKYLEIFKESISKFVNMSKGRLKIYQNNRRLSLKGTLEINFNLIRSSLNNYEAYIDRYDVILVVHRRLDDEVYGNMKLKSVRSINLSRLSKIQIIDVERLRDPLIDIKYMLTNLFHALYVKGGYTPYHIRISNFDYIEKELKRSLFVGIALKKMYDNYLKGIASIMSSDFKVITNIEDTLKLEGESQELTESELMKLFVHLKDKIETIESLYRQMNRSLRHVILFRSRRPNESELRLFKTLIKKKGSVLVNKNRFLWIIGWSKLRLEKSCKWVLQSGKIYHMPLVDEKEYRSGILIAGITHDDFQHPAILRYHVFSKGDHIIKNMVWQYVYAFYEISRKLHVTNPYPLNKSTPAPLKYSRNLLKWHSYVALKWHMGS